MKSDRLAVVFRGRPPFAAAEHFRLMFIAEQGATFLADVARRAWVALVPTQLFELQGLEVIALRARHEEAALIGGQEFPLDPRLPLERRRRDHEHLAPLEGARARFGERDRVTLEVDVARITVDFVEKEIAHRRRAQAHGGVGPGHQEQSAGEFLGQHRVARVPRTSFLDPAPQRRAFLDHRRDALLRRALGHLDRWQHGEHRARRLVDDVADPIVAALRRPDLRTFHQCDALTGAGGG